MPPNSETYKEPLSHSKRHFMCFHYYVKFIRNGYHALSKISVGFSILVVMRQMGRVGGGGGGGGQLGSTVSL